MNSTDPRTVTSPLIRRTLLTVLAWITPSAALGAYLVGLVLGLSTESILWALTWVLPPVYVVAGLLLPWGGITLLVQRNFHSRPGEPSSQRLTRLQKLPWKLAAMGTMAPYTLGGFIFTLPVVLRFDKDPQLVGLGMLVAMTLGLVLSVPVGIKLEQLLMPHVLEERNRERARADARGFFWLRQSWYLPYMFAVSLASTLALMGLVSTHQTHELRDAHSRALLEDPSLPAEQAALLVGRMHAFSDALLSSMGPPLLALGAFTLLVPTLAAWMLARRQARAVAALQEALEGLANGAPFAPRWASTDEVGDLATAMVALLSRLEEIPTRLQAAARQLLEASTALGAAVQEQRQGLAEQTSALQEAQTTSESIRTISMLAAQRADSVLSVASHAEQLGSHGEAAIEETLSGLSTIRQFVDGIHGKVVRLQESATQIGDITLTVKDLADQSNLLALNASIEAARSGEHGAGFGVVAWEIRKLADQSVRETARIRKSLLDIIRAIRDVASMSEQGAWQVEGGLERAKSSGDNLREMSLIIGDNAAAVRQIAAAVNQQNAGITHIFTAISQLSNGMETTVKRLDTTLQATQTLQGVIHEVMEVARKYQGRGEP